MKKNVFMCVAAILVSALFFSVSCQSGGAEQKNSSADSVIETITTARAVTTFTDEKVPDEDAEKILRAGLAAQSGLNRQPWYFSAVSDKSVLVDIASQYERPDVPRAQIEDAPFAVIVSSSSRSAVDSFSCGLAVQNMIVASLELGYGTKVVAAPTVVFNGEQKDHYKQLLGIPDGYDFLVALLIGKSAGGQVTDVTAGATPRDSFEEKVTFIK